MEGLSLNISRISLDMGLGSLDVLDGPAGAGAGQGDLRANLSHSLKTEITKPTLCDIF